MATKTAAPPPVRSSTRKYFYAHGTLTFQRPDDWNPNDNMIEIVSGGGGCPIIPVGNMTLPGSNGGTYAVATNTNPIFPLTTAGFAVNSFNLVGNTYVLDANDNIICQASAEVTFPAGNFGGQTSGVGGSAGSGAGGPSGPGIGGGSTGGYPNAYQPYSWPNGYALGFGGDPANNGQNFGGGAGGDPGNRGGSMSGGFTGGLSLVVISWEPFVAAPAAMVTIMA